MEVTQHPAFNVYAICSAFLVLKMLIVGHYTALIRFRKQAFLNPEDAEALRSPESPVAAEHPDVERALRAHRNDLESTLPFLAIGWVYLAVGVSAASATWLISIFAVGRILFSILYFTGIQPWRSIIFLVSEGCLLVMLGQIVYQALG